MRKHVIHAALAIGFGLAVIPQMASACSIVAPDDWGPADSRRAARVAVGTATAIIDGEVIRPFIHGKQNAIVRAARVLKGPRKVEFEVGERSSCDRALDRVGERFRMILTGGPAVYYLPDGGSEAVYEDELLGSYREVVWPYTRGTEP
ncbi:hypothetical protein [Inquilinus sp.]|jgi:hypothetical protein|uniref:hypothetical protein n=1 Tax=Inquilinus sp. TaxID=1932117 RepID=UPI003783AEF8